MIVELTRTELTILCRHCVERLSLPNLKSHKFRFAYERREFVNGYHYKLSEAWLREQTDQQLLEFYIYHSPTIKLISNEQ